MSTVPQIQSVAQLRSTRGFTIVRLGSNQVAKKSITPPSSSNEILASSSSNSSSVLPIATPMTSNNITTSESKKESKPGTPRLSGGSRGVGAPGTPGTQTPTRYSPPETPTARTPSSVEDSDTICLIGSDCYKTPYIPIMFYDEA